MIRTDIENRERRRAVRRFAIFCAVFMPAMTVACFYCDARLRASVVERAHKQARRISSALEVYRSDYGYYPSSLNDLYHKNGRFPPQLSDENELYDPWGQPYGYDPNGGYRSNIGPPVLGADVFTIVPDGSNRIIGNWNERGEQARQPEENLLNAIFALGRR